MAGARSLNGVELLGLVELVIIILDGISNRIVLQILLVQILVGVVELGVGLQSLAGFVLVRRVQVAVALANGVSQRIQVALLIESRIHHLREVALASDLLSLRLHFSLLVLHRLLLGTILRKLVQAATRSTQNLRLGEVGAVIVSALTRVVHGLLHMLLLVVVVRNLRVIVQAPPHLIAGVLRSLVMAVLDQFWSVSAAVRQVVVLGRRRSLVACEVQNVVLHLLASQVLILLNWKRAANVLVGLSLGTAVATSAVLTQSGVVVRCLDYGACVLVTSSSWSGMFAR